jgi:hypothetical protein
LVEDANNERRKDGENDVVQGKSPGLIDDLAGEVVEEGVLRTELAVIQLILGQTYPELCHIQDNILVEGICRGVKTIREAKGRMTLTENKLA